MAETSDVQGDGVTRGETPYEVKLENPGRDAAEQRGRNLQEQFLQSPTAVLDALDDEVEAMPIAERFSPDRSIADNLNRGGRTVHEGLSEKDAKREGLKIKLRQLRERQNRLAAEVADIVLNIEATKRDH